MTKIIWKNTDIASPYLTEKEGVPFLKYRSLEETGIVRHGFSTRAGGVSEGIYQSMNLSFTRGDESWRVTENYHRMAAALEIPYESIVTSDQTHTINVRKVGKSDRGSGLTRPRDFTDVDGMITDEPQTALATFYADCVPLFFVDPVHHCIGLSHSGWRGTKDKMGLVTVQAMQKEYGTNPSDLLTAIGPSICQDCYEVSEDVIEEFSASFAPNLHEKLFFRKDNGKYQLNLWEANVQVLREAGVPDPQIERPNLCTCCNPELLFSHRASHGKRGNLGAFLMLI
ncbi:MAG: peptidoglycan editing factor PgeF [Lachnospiraceae bacterium]|nr:peptidoglycan editing factor PgeF [Lachnospiraceae bacterium]